MDTKNLGGISPLHLASKNGHIEAVRLLLEKGALVVAKDKGDNSPLHLASKNGHRDIVNLLLEKGVALKASRTKRQLQEFASVSKHP